MKVLFAGTPAFSVPSLEALVASKHEVAGVLTMPDRKRGRGQKWSDGNSVWRFDIDYAAAAH